MELADCEMFAVIQQTGDDENAGFTLKHKIIDVYRKLQMFEQ